MSKVALITGASSGFGAATAAKLAALGWQLILVARREQRLVELQHQLGESNCFVYPLDVGNRQAVERLFAELPTRLSHIDLLVNSAGGAIGLDAAHKADLDDWETMIRANINGLMYCTHAVLPGMVARNRGQIINIGSMAANWPYPGGNVYGATKAFVKQFSNNLRADLLGTAVRVTNIEPGLAETEFSLVRFKGDAEKAAGVYADTEPLVADNIAEMIVWISHQPPHVNINQLEVMPTCQAWGPLAVHHSTKKNRPE